MPDQLLPAAAVGVVPPEREADRVARGVGEGGEGQGRRAGVDANRPEVGAEGRLHLVADAPGERGAARAPTLAGSSRAAPRSLAHTGSTGPPGYHGGGAPQPSSRRSFGRADRRSPARGRGDAHVRSVMLVSSASCLMSGGSNLVRFLTRLLVRIVLKAARSVGCG